MVKIFEKKEGRKTEHTKGEKKTNKFKMLQRLFIFSLSFFVLSLFFCVYKHNSQRVTQKLKLYKLLT